MPKWDVNRKYAKSILNTIGSTPLVRLNRVTSGIKPEILVKLEYFSPSGSLKDRIYLNMIEKAERRGALKKGMTILECSTGNAGIACSFIAAVKGYPCIIVMPDGMSEERKKTDVAYGAQMVLEAALAVLPKASGYDSIHFAWESFYDLASLPRLVTEDGAQHGKLRVTLKGRLPRSPKVLRLCSDR